jgi:hypothetical protein
MTENHMKRGYTDGIRKWLSVLVCLMVMTVALGTPAYSQEEAAPTPDPAQQVPNDPTAPQTNGNTTPGATEEVTPEPTEQPAGTTEPRSTSNQTTNTTTQTRGAQRAEDAAGPGSPAVLAHGLAYVSGDDVVWQVREIQVPEVSDAVADATDEAILLQRDGTTIVRNNATGKRALLNPGEAFFRASDDTYTVSSEDSGSVAWQFELVDPDDVDLDAFYESPVIDDVDEAVYDMMLTRYVLRPGEEADMPDHSGAGMIMVTSGEAQVDMGGELTLLGSGDGQSLRGDTLVSNEGDRAVVFVYVYLGEEVGDATAAAPEGPAATSQAPSDGTTSTDSDPTAVEPTAEPASPGTAPTTDSGAFLTSINVTADIDIYLVITVDGLTVFDGTLPAGTSSGPVTGSVFEIYTSSGVNTNFTNACGDYFKMGFEEGEAYYTLAATAESCAP